MYLFLSYVSLSAGRDLGRSKFQAKQKISHSLGEIIFLISQSRFLPRHPPSYCCRTLQNVQNVGVAHVELDDSWAANGNWNTTRDGEVSCIMLLTLGTELQCLNEHIYPAYPHCRQETA